MADICTNVFQTPSYCILNHGNSYKLINSSNSLPDISCHVALNLPLGS